MEGDEVFVFAGVGDGPVKLHVGQRCCFKVGALVVHFLQGAFHALQIARVAALGSNGGRLGFDPQAHFEHLREVRASAIFFRKAEHRTGRGLRNKRAQATAGGQHAIGLELGNRLAHHRTADIQLFRQLLLGRQARLGRQLSGVNLGPYGADNTHDEGIWTLELKHGKT